MTTYRPATVSQEPDAILTHYAIFEIEPGNHHFAGFNLMTGDGRVSSRIVTWNPDTKVGITRSGRRYKLEEFAGYLHDDALYVWETWCKVNGVKSYTDVTNQYVHTDGRSCMPGPEDV